MKTFLLLASNFAVSAFAAAAAACNRDNVLRCLVSNSAIATPYCSSYISIPVVTKTDSTFTPLTTTTTTLVITSTDIVSTTDTTTATVVNPVFKRDLAYNHEDNPPPGLPVITARAVAASPSPPACLSQVGGTLYPASRISSACSCLSVSTSTLSVTATAPTSTQTVTESTSITVTTTFITSTTTTTTLTPTCTGSITGGGFTYRRVYKGAGFTENYNNPGNNNVGRPPLIQNYPASIDTCSALSQCQLFAVNSLEIYYSFDLHFLTSQNQWECVAFYNGNSDAAYFNVANADVEVAFGYTIT